MSERTEKLAKIDHWENLRGRFLVAWLLGAALILALLFVSEPSEDDWETLPPSLLFAVTGGLAMALGLLFLGMTMRWQTLSRRLTLPACALLVTGGTVTAATCVFLTNAAPRSPLGIAETQHMGAFVGGLAAATFGAVNWPARPRR